MSEYVFPGGGKRGYLRDPRAAFERIKTKAGLPEGSRLLHGCRHHYATMLVAEGVDVLTVARLLGHRDAQMVLRTYAHVRPGVLAEAAALSGRLITATSGNLTRFPGLLRGPREERTDAKAPRRMDHGRPA